MSNQTTNPNIENSLQQSRHWFKYLVLGVQTFFGSWFLIHGLNHWIHFFPQPAGSDSLTHVLINSLIQTGLFDWVKAGEIISGIMLLSHRFIPLGIILAVPPALVIVYINMFLNYDFSSRFVALIILAILVVLGLGYLDSFRSILRYNVGDPGTKGIDEFLGK